MSLDNYEIINKSCNCSCHKHKHHNRFHQHALNNNLSISKFGKLEISQIMDNNKKVDENRNIQSKIVWINETKFIFELEICKYYDCSKTE